MHSQFSLIHYPTERFAHGKIYVESLQKAPSSEGKSGEAPFVDKPSWL